MGSKVQRESKIPGPPTQVESAYLAGLIDRGGGFTVDPMGLKIRSSKDAAAWLVARFGGHFYLGPISVWWLTTQAELEAALSRAFPHMHHRKGECRAFLDLLEHHMDPERPWHGSPPWREQRDQLRAALRGVNQD